MGHLGVFACWLAAGVFGVAGIAKLRRADEFVAAVAALRLVPARHTRPVAAVVGAAELVVSALCLVPSSPMAPAGLALAVALLVGFAGVAMSARLRRRVVPCRCFGRHGAPLGLRHVLRNAVLAAVSVAGLAAWLAAPAPDAGPGLVLTGVAAVVAVALVVMFDDLVDLFRLPASSTERKAIT